MAKVEFYAESKESPDKKAVRDVLEEEKGLSIQYTDGSAKSIEIKAGGSAGGTSGGVSVEQVTKLDVVAPMEVQIPVRKESTYAFAPFEVLKFKDGETDVEKTVYDFNVSDAVNFQTNEYVQFDGTMELVKEKNYKTSQVKESDLKEILIDKSQIKQIQSIEIESTSVVRYYTCYGEKDKRIGKHDITLSPGNYTIECFGGGTNGQDHLSYCRGDINLKSETELYLHVAGAGLRCGMPGNANGGYNGGGLGGFSAAWNVDPPWSGGGAADVRLIGGDWDDASSLKSRIMVAGGVAGKGRDGFGGADAGGIAGQSNSYSSTGGTQTSGGSGGSAQGWTNGAGGFGKGGDVTAWSLGYYGGGGGSGYYGGGAGAPVSTSASGGSGGSSFISGHEGCNAIDENGEHTGQPVHYSGFIFQNTMMKGSNESNVAPTASGRLTGEGLIIIRKNVSNWILAYENKTFTIIDHSLVDLGLTESMIDQKVFNENGFKIDDLILLENKLDKEFRLLNYDDVTLMCTLVPNPQLVLPDIDLPIFNFELIKNIRIVTSGAVGIAKVIISFDQGKTWKTFVKGIWENIDLNSSAIKENGIDYNQLAAITESKWSEQFSGKIRLAYYLEKEDLSDDLAIDSLVIIADLRGVWHRAIPGTDYEYEYPSNDVLSVQLLKDGSYKINTLVDGGGTAEPFVPKPVKPIETNPR